jgi:ParB/RepB/Spo0J family partition protein
VNKTSVKRDRELKWLALEKIIKNERNPRQKASFVTEQLAPLQLSIEEHGILEPLMVQPYDDDMYLLLEGERRWTVAKSLGIKEVPAVIVNRQDEHEQVVLMFNIHHQRKGWEMAEELTAVRELKERNGHLSDDELAKKLGISAATLRDRLQVLAMGDEVIADIAKDKLDYSSALRSDQLARSLARKRPNVTEKMGGEAAIRRNLLTKAKKRARGGISQELVEARKDLVDEEAMPDELVAEYLAKPDVKLKEVRRRTESLEERRKVEDLSREMRRVEREITLFRIDLEAAPNLRELRNSLASLISAAQNLEQRVTDAIHNQEENRAGH